MSDLQRNSAAFTPSYLGWGYRSYAKQLSTATVFDANSYSLGAQGFYVTVNFGVVANNEHFEEAFSADAEVSGGGNGISANAKASLSERYSRDVTSVTIALTKRVMAGRFTLNVSKFPLDAVAAETAQRDAADYVSSYGDQVVTKVGMGGACCYFFKFNFKSQQEASSFAASIGASYGSFSGSVSEARSTLLQQKALEISLAGYSTGTIDVPEVIKNSPVRDKASFLFDPQTGDTIIRNLFDFFDRFQNNFSKDYAKDPSQFPQYSQVDIEYSSLHQISAPVFPKKKEITQIGDLASAIAGKLDDQNDLALRRLNELTYMMNRCSDYNTEDAKQQAKAFMNTLNELCGENGKIQRRRLDLEQNLKLEPNYDFSSDIPDLPLSFCTVDPDKPRTSGYRLTGDPGHVTLYTFAISRNDYGRTCRIEAQAMLRQYDANDTAHAKIELVKKKKGVTVPSLRKVMIAKDDSSWESIEAVEGSCGHNDARPLILSPVLFVPSEDEMYAIKAYAGPGQVYQQDLTLTTYVSRQRADIPTPY